MYVAVMQITVTDAILRCSRGQQFTDLRGQAGRHTVQVVEVMASMLQLDSHPRQRIFKQMLQVQVESGMPLRLPVRAGVDRGRQCPIAISLPAVYRDLTGGKQEQRRVPTPLRGLNTLQIPAIAPPDGT